MSYEFETTTYGKWILAGEHAVLRGNGALVYPLKQKYLTLRYKTSSSELHADYSGQCGEDMRLLFWSVLEHGQQLLGQSLNKLTGYFHLESNIPLGVGMGASAALCVAMARWFAAQQFLTSESIPLFAKNLENLFHGKSSGLDIAGVSADSGIYFKQGKITPFLQTWQPIWYLSSCEQIGITSHCIHKVDNLWQSNSQKATLIDENMEAAVNKAQLALKTNEPDALMLLKEAIDQSAECFRSWELVGENLSQHMQMLLKSGALAVKPTGSGAGGYVLSLWENLPPELPFELINAA
jgi:mevalonate kinase